MPKDHSKLSDETFELPVAGQTLKEPDRVIDTYKFHFTSKTSVAQLKSILKGYGLSTRGTKECLVGRLREYADDRESWIKLFKPAPTKVRGGRGSTRKSHSAKRIAEMFPDAETVVEYRNRYDNDQRPIERLPQAQTTNNLIWARDVMKEYTYREMLQVSESSSCNSEYTNNEEQSLPQQRVLEQPSGITVTPPIPSLMRQLKHQVNGLEDRTVMSFNRLEAKLDNMKIQLLNSQTQLPSGFIQQEANGAETEYSQTDLASVAQKSTTTLSSLSTVPQSETRPLHKPNSSSSCANIASPSLPEESFLATVYLGSEKFTFDKREVKSPSIYQYSKDIPLLFVEWENSQRLIINNRGIALKFWPEFYQKKNHIGNGHIWNSIKMMWGNWKFIVDEKNHLGSEDAFWERYTDEDGKRMTYQKILNLLQSSRDDAAIRDATTARRFFEGNMDSKLARKVFTYKKKGITHDCKQDKAIAQKWRDLIHNDPNVRAQWEMMEQQLRIGFELGSDAAGAGC